MSLLTPILGFKSDYCREGCTACTRVCPSGALKRLVVDDKAKVPLGLPTVDMSVCLLGDERECSECKRWCPHEAIRYVFSEAEYTLVPVIDATTCTGCGACEMACPVKPKKAIVVAPLPS
jgi:formate hydrogenlyase subunit 6/NADH:ubiquinone oxidoreductase subunit I